MCHIDPFILRCNMTKRDGRRRFRALPLNPPGPTRSREGAAQPHRARIYFLSLPPKLLSFAVLMALGGTAPAGINNSAVNRALTNINGNAAAVRANAGDRFVAKDTIVDRNGDEHVRFQRSYAGMDVIGGDFVTHSHGGALRSVSQTLTSNARPSTRPGISRDSAIDAAGADFGTGFEGMPTARLVVYAMNTTPKLAYEVVFAGQKRNGDPTEMHYFVDASSAKILNK